MTANSTQFDSLKQRELKDRGLLSHELVKAPDYIWRVDTYGKIYSAGLRYAWETPEEASIRALKNGQPDNGQGSSFFSSYSRQNNRVSFVGVNTLQPFLSTYGKYRLKSLGAEPKDGPRVVKLVFEDNFKWEHELRDRVQSIIGEIVKNPDNNVIGFTKPHDGGDPTVEYYVDIACYEREQTVEFSVKLHDLRQ